MIIMGAINSQASRGFWRMARPLTCQQPSGCLVMPFNQLPFIRCAELSFFDNKCAADNCVIHIDRLPKDDSGNRIVHAGETNPVEVHGEEIGALSTFQAADILSANHRSAPACA